MRQTNNWGRRGLAAGLCTIAAAAAGLAAGCSQSGSGAAAPVAAAAAPVVGVVPVARQNLARTVTIAAEFRPYQDIAVDAKVAGYIQHIYVDYGDQVKTGQLLAVLEVPELGDQIDQAKAAVEQSKEGVQRAQDMLTQAQANYRASHLDYTRLDKVITTQPGLVAQQEVDDALGKDQANAAQVSAATAGLSEAQQQLAASQADLQRLETMFAYTRITAPFPGVITNRYADTGAMIQAGTTQAMPIVQLAQDDVLRLGIPVPEADVRYIHVGMPAQVQVTALNKTFPGTVTRFSDKVDFDTRTMYTEVDVQNADGVLVPGMYAYATLPLEQRDNAIAVPVQALSQGTNGETAMVVDGNGQVETRTVTVGLQTANADEVLSGLNVGDRVVVSGASLLRNGQIVQPKTVTLPTVAAATGGNS